jgi:hypothetical protein
LELEGWGLKLLLFMGEQRFKKKMYRGQSAYCFAVTSRIEDGMTKNSRTQRNNAGNNAGNNANASVEFRAKSLSCSILVFQKDNKDLNTFFLHSDDHGMKNRKIPPLVDFVLRNSSHRNGTIESINA